jgi:myo-inositol 2-dehydrogenase / D-chiro-inositol 1-dehydrogenase
MTSQPGAGRRSDRVRLGIVGLGAVAQAVHLPLLERLRDAFSIQAIADLSPSLVTAIGDRYQVAARHRVDSIEVLVALPDIDALIILTSGSHGPAVLAGLDAGLPVFAEKPLAYTLAEADAIAERLEADMGRRLQVGYMKLYDPAVVHARALAAERGFGSPRAIEVTVLHPTSEAQLAHARLIPPPTDIVDSTRARLTDLADRLRRDALGEPAGRAFGRLYTDILLGSVVHELALIRLFAGDPTGIDDLVIWPQGAWPPSLELTGRLPADGRISVRWHYLPTYPAYREEVRIVYEGATIELAFPSPYLLHRPTVLRVTSDADDGRNDEVWTSTDEAFEEELLAFHALVVDGRTPAAGLTEGRADIVTCQRAVRAIAARTDTPIGGEAAA